jgi:hypothetical protein
VSRTQARDVARLLQGALIAAANSFALNVLRDGKLYQQTDEQGIYQPYFDIHLRSGALLRVTVEVVRDPG